MRALYAAFCLVFAACLDEAPPQSCPESSAVAGATCELEDGSRCSAVAATGAPGAVELGCCTDDGWQACVAVAP